MTREERRHLRKQLKRADNIIYELGVFCHYFRDKPIGFETIHVLTNASTMTNILDSYANLVRDKLKYKPRRKKKK